jgi:hypothetical protein
LLAVKKASEFTGEPMAGLNWSNFLTGSSAAVKAPAGKEAVKKAAPAVVKKASVKTVAKKASTKKSE